MSSIDKEARDRIEQGKETDGEKRKQGHSSGGSGSSSQLDRINNELAKSNLTDSARKALEGEKTKLLGQ
ncbi:MAG TPA: hypothetical protein DD001_21585 [Microcoleaceae bacterium UBA10368]|jgi:hypothetical protein|nr:hypothetical protein [Microcoleaceae cyanobacterium UBA10368]HCV30037.1 hypothetical protein [Microcoleaceae cyanobacterium UBA9251]